MGIAKGATWKAWKRSELRILEKHYGRTTKQDMMAKLPGRTWIAIEFMASQRGFTRDNALYWMLLADEYYKARKTKLLLDGFKLPEHVLRRLHHAQLRYAEDDSGSGCSKRLATMIR